LTQSHNVDQPDQDSEQ